MKSRLNLINAMEAGNRQQVNALLAKYKSPEGAVNFPDLFAIKTEDRLPVLFQKNPARIASICVTAITFTMQAMNLARPMNAAQIMDLADTILESSAEDNLSLEDLLLFLQKLTRGEYGKLYESMDIPKFMQLFEVYREERFKAMKLLRDEQDVQYRALPVFNRLPNLRTMLNEDGG